MIKKFIMKRLGAFIFYTLVGVFILYGMFSIQEAKRNAIAAQTYSYEAPEANVDKSAAPSYKKITGSENLELYFDEGRGTVQVKNTDTGYIWKSIVEEEDYSMDKLNRQWKAYLQSVFTIKYNDISKRNAPPATAYAGSDCDFMEFDYVDNGVEVKYGFTGIGLFVKLQYLLEDGRFVVRVPYEGYEERMQYLITTLEIMPFFGAAGNEVDGYMLYPDGSGAITQYANVKNRSSKVKQGLLRTYSNKNVSIQEYMDSDYYERYVASLPVFGIKNGNDAVLAAVTEGIEETGVMTYPSGIVVDLNRINFEVYVRNVFDVSMFNVSTGVNTTSKGAEIQRVDEEFIKRDREITYFFLSGEDANYSKMAGTYRDYLTEEKLLTGVIEEGSAMPLALEFLMGATESGMLYDKYIAMTGFDRLVEIFERLKSQGVTDLKVLLASWQKDGVNYPDYWPVAPQIGGAGGLKAVDGYVAENEGMDIFLENNFTFAIKETGGFSATEDIVYSGVNVPVTAGYTRTWFLLNPQVAYNRAMDFINRLKGYTHIGVGYEYLGRIVYPDYNQSSPFTRSETVEMWQKLLGDTRTQGRKTAVEGFNQYTYKHADYLYSVPLKGFGLAIEDASVPFVQMVLSGKIPFSSMAGNLSYDLDIQKLQWIEYGALPFFKLTYEDSVLLKETDYNSLFTSTYDKWEERVLAVYREFRENFASVYGKQMTLHETLSDGVVRVGYENGVLIYLNYNEGQKLVNGLELPAKGYLITAGEEN